MRAEVVGSDGSTVLDAVRKSGGVIDEAVEVQPQRSGTLVVASPLRDALGTATQQRDPAANVPPLQMREPDRELGQPAPELALHSRSGLPGRLQHLVRVERHACIEQALGLAHGFVGGEDEILGDPLDP